MKATRKLIPAIAMLLISAVMMSTATFAWFSSNGKVTADGMSITAKSDNIFITISTTADNKQGTATAVTANPVVGGARLPAKATVATKTEGESTVEYLKWETGTGKTATEGEAASELTDITSLSTLDKDYYVTTTFYIRSATGFPDAVNLKLAGISVTNKDGTTSPLSNFASAVGVALATTDAAGKTTYTVYDKDTNAGSYDFSKDIAAKVTSTGDVTVQVYIFINGEHEMIESANASADNMTEMKITLEFTAGAASN